MVIFYRLVQRLMRLTATTLTLRRRQGPLAIQVTGPGLTVTWATSTGYRGFSSWFAQA